MSNDFLVPMLFEPHELFDPFFFTSIYDIKENGILLRCHEVPIYVLSIIGNLRLVNDGSGVVALLKNGPKPIICS